MLPSIKPYIIGETAFHHQGDKDFLRNLVDAAAELQLDAIKLHLLFDINNYFVASHPAISAVNEWIFSKEQYADFFKYANEKKLDVIALCNDPASIQWINNECETPVKAIELHATGINDVFLLEEAIKFKGTVILGVGGSSLEQIQFAVEILKNQGQEDIFLMYGFQNYPTDYKDLNFSKMTLLKDLFKLPLGYADHTDPTDEFNEVITASAIMKGINVIEKHFTFNVKEKRIDAQAAVSLAQMKKLKRLCELMFVVNGNGEPGMSEAEKKYGDTGPMKKAIVAAQDIPANHVLELKDLAYKRTQNSTYIEQKDIFFLLGLKTQKEIKMDEIIDYTSVEYRFKMAETDQFFKNKK